MLKPHPLKIPWKAILVVIAFVLSLVIKGLDTEEAIKQAAKGFGIPESILRRFMRS
jgi:hypothetical protein